LVYFIYTNGITYELILLYFEFKNRSKFLVLKKNLVVT
jgi:hypothetical protein